MEEFKQQADSFHVWTWQGRETITAGMFKSDSVPVPFLTSFIPHIFGIVLGKQAQVPLQEPLVPLFQQVAVQMCVHALDGYRTYNIRPWNAVFFLSILQQTPALCLWPQVPLAPRPS